MRNARRGKKGSAPPASARIVATAVRVAPPAEVPQGWTPFEALQGLAGDLTRRLDARDDLKVVALRIAEEGRPAVRLGCAGDDETGGDLGEECDLEQRGMRFAITQGSRKWRAALPSALVGAGADHLLLIDVAVRDH